MYLIKYYVVAPQVQNHFTAQLRSPLWGFLFWQSKKQHNNNIFAVETIAFAHTCTQKRHIHTQRKKQGHAQSFKFQQSRSSSCNLQTACSRTPYYYSLRSLALAPMWERKLYAIKANSTAKKHIFDMWNKWTWNNYINACTCRKCIGIYATNLCLHF